jgi:hypothetical protein
MNEDDAVRQVGYERLDGDISTGNFRVQPRELAIIKATWQSAHHFVNVFS